MFRPRSARQAESFTFNFTFSSASRASSQERAVGEVPVASTGLAGGQVDSLEENSRCNNSVCRKLTSCCSHKQG